jgi:hypothetical protein
MGYLLCIYERPGLTTKVAIIKPLQRHKYNTKTIQIHKNKTLSKQSKNYMAGTQKYKRNTKAKALKSEKKKVDIKMSQIRAEFV